MELRVALTTVLFLCFLLDGLALSIDSGHYCKFHDFIRSCLCTKITMPHQDNLEFNVSRSDPCTTYIIQLSDLKRIPAKFLDIGDPAEVIWILKSNLKEIRQEDFHAPECHFLDLSKNDLTTLPAHVFSGMPKLQKLWIKENNLRHLRGGCFSGLSGLYSLRLQHNQIENLDSNILRPLTNLSELDLGYNNIKYIRNEVFSSNRKLQDLNLESNNLIIVDSYITSCPKGFEFVKAHEGHPTTNTDLFASLRELKSFNVAGNIFVVIGPNTFYNNAHLEKLDMTNAYIFCIAGRAFMDNQKLTNISLGSNDLKEIDMNLFATTRSLVYLDLHSNSLSELKNLRDIRIPVNLTHLNVKYNNFGCEYLDRVLQGSSNVALGIDIVNRRGIDCLTVPYEQMCDKIPYGSRCQEVSYEF